LSKELVCGLAVLLFVAVVIFWFMADLDK